MERGLKGKIDVIIPLLVNQLSRQHLVLVSKPLGTTSSISLCTFRVKGFYLDMEKVRRNLERKIKKNRYFLQTQYVSLTDMQRFNEKLMSTCNFQN